MPSSEIDLGEYFSPTELVQEILNSRERVSVLPDNFIDAPEVYTKSEGSILLSDEQYGVPARELELLMSPLPSI